MTDNDTQSLPENGADLYKHWKGEVDLALKWRTKYWERADKVMKVYRDDREQALVDKGRQMNLYFASVETEKPSIFSNVAKPDIRRRLTDGDRIARISAEILERATTYCWEECQDIYRVCSALRDDLLIPGQCVGWVRYVPTFKEKADESQQPYQAIAEQKVITDHVQYRDFLHNEAREETEIRWKARRHLLTQAEVQAQFGEKVAKSIKRTWMPLGISDTIREQEDQDRYKKAEIWEIWNIEDRTVYFWCVGYEAGCLKVQPDELGLRGFFPTPAALLAITTADSTEPIPPYCQVQDQLTLINKLTGRIDCLVDALKANGAYPQELGPVFQNLYQGENRLIPVPNWPAFDKAGGTDVVAWVPIEQIVSVLTQLYDARDREQQIYYEISGYSDIQRGATDPNETAKAQEIKADYGSIRVRLKQMNFQRYLRELVRINAEIIKKHFEPQTFYAVAGVGGYSEPISEEEFNAAIGLLRSEPYSNYAIDVETDSTVMPDDNAEKSRVTEFMGTIPGMLEQAINTMNTMPALTEVVSQLLLFGVRGFKAGRGLEDSLQRAFQGIMQAQQQPQGPPAEDPAMVQAQAAREFNQVELEKVKVQGMKAQADYQAKVQEMEREHAVKVGDLQQKVQDNQAQWQLKARELDLRSRELDIQTMELALEEKKLQAEVGIKAYEAVKPDEAPQKQHPILGI